jgi:Zn-dependent protease
MNPNDIIIMIFGFSLAISVHESAHAWMAKQCGDPTAAMQGRISLNPMDHVDLFGTIILPFILIISHAPFLFGWAKPVMINPRNFKNPKIDERWVAAAGPISNIIVAIIFALIFRGLTHFLPTFSSLLSLESLKTIARLCILTVNINLVFAVFNMIPISPLDGSRWFVPS